MGQKVREKMKSQAENRVRHELGEYLADAFGTYVMGPAYPCAAIHLRFSPVVPSDPDAENRVDRERAHVVLGMLDKMNQTVLGRVSTYAQRGSRNQRGELQTAFSRRIMGLPNTTFPRRKRRGCYS